MVPVGAANGRRFPPLDPPNQHTMNLCAGLVFCTALLAVSPASAAQVAELTRTGGVLGESVSYTLNAPAPTLAVWVPSFQAGPTPLAILDPLDPRSLELGTDLLFFAQVLAAGPAPAPFAVPLPSLPSLEGVEFRAQFLTVGGGPTLFDLVSNLTAFRFASAGSSHPALNTRTAALDGHTATLLPDGRVLLAGGVDLGAGGAPTGTLEIWDPATQRFSTLVATLNVARSAHTATLLADGRVLVAGGSGAGEVVLASAEIIDPVLGTVTPAGNMTRARVTHTATLLPDGRVFAAGGISLINPADQFSALLNTERTTESFDPISATWTAGPLLPQKLTGHAAALGSDGRVLIAGGLEVTTFFGLPLPTIVAAARRFDPVTNSFVATAALPSPRAFHSLTALPDGRLLSVGGANLAGVSYTILNNVTRYDPSNNAWSNLAPLVRPRAYPNVVRTDVGLAAIGGLATIDTTAGTGAVETAIEVALFDLANWTIAGALLQPRLSAISVAVEGGERILTTGASSPTDNTGEVYVP